MGWVIAFIETVSYSSGELRGDCTSLLLILCKMEAPKYRYNIVETMGSQTVYTVHKYHSFKTEHSDVSTRYKEGLEYGLKITFLLFSTA